MANANDRRIRVILRLIQIHHNLEPSFEEEGEFRFRARVSSRNGGGVLADLVLPGDDSYYSVSDHPAWNRLYLNKVLFEGELADHLEVEVSGEELDFLSSNEKLETYRRTWEGDPASWIGYYEAGDEGPDDPERLETWGVAIEIEKA